MPRTTADAGNERVTARQLHERCRRNRLQASCASTTSACRSSMCACAHSSATSTTRSTSASPGARRAPGGATSRNGSFSSRRSSATIVTSPSSGSSIRASWSTSAGCRAAAREHAEVDPQLTRPRARLTDYGEHISVVTRKRPVLTLGRLPAETPERDRPPRSRPRARSRRHPLRCPRSGARAASRRASGG